MNEYINDNFPWLLENSALPHQIATIDFMFRGLENNNRLFIYHIMGSGKTIVVLLFCLLYQKKFPDKKILIQLPSKNVVQIWRDALLKVVLPMYNLQIDNDKLIFESFNINTITSADLLIYDESHKIFNSMDIYIEEMDKKESLKTILLSGSPITNTVLDILPIYRFFGNTSGMDIIKKGQRVISIFLNDEKAEDIKTLLKGKISYYNNDKILNSKIVFKGESALQQSFERFKAKSTKEENTTKNEIEKNVNIELKDKNPNLEEVVAGGLISRDRLNEENEIIAGAVSSKDYYSDDLTNIDVDELDSILESFYDELNDFDFNIVICPMSHLQNLEYEFVYNTNEKNNFMFSNKFLDISLASIGRYRDNKNKKIIYEATDDHGSLSLNKNGLMGSELKLLNISSKLKYFIDSLKNGYNMGKHFVFFRNVQYGSLILESVLKENGIFNYKNKEISGEYFLCYLCGNKKECKECFPMKYILITGNTNPLDISKMINNFNSDLNDNGKYCNIIIGSEIISESFSFNEVKNYWLMTIPDTKGKFYQTKYRIMRQFSHKKYTEINGYILVAMPTKVPSFDLKKISYLILKEFNSKKGDDILKESSKKYNEKPIKELERILIINYLRKYFYENDEINDYNNFIKTNKLFKDKDSFNEKVNSLVNEGLTCFNKKMGNSVLTNIDNKVKLIPLFLKFPHFKIKVPISKMNYNYAYIEDNNLHYKGIIYSLDNVPEDIKKDLINAYSLEGDFKNSIINRFKELNKKWHIYYVVKKEEILNKDIMVYKKNGKIMLQWKEKNINLRNITSIEKPLLLELCEKLKIQVPQKIKINDLIDLITSFFKEEN